MPEQSLPRGHDPDILHKAVGRGLVRIDPSGVLVGYAARGGTLALDGEGRNSPYAQALLQHIEEPGSRSANCSARFGIPSST